MKFTDSLSENLEVVRELLSGLPPDSRHNAKKAAASIENVIVALRKDYPRNPAVALGVAFAIFKIAEDITRPAEDADGKTQKSMIQLLS